MCSCTVPVEEMAEKQSRSRAMVETAAIFIAILIIWKRKKNSRFPLSRLFPVRAVRSPPLCVCVFTVSKGSDPRGPICFHCWKNKARKANVIFRANWQTCACYSTFTASESKIYNRDVQLKIIKIQTNPNKQLHL